MAASETSKLQQVSGAPFATRANDCEHKPKNKKLVVLQSLAAELLVQTVSKHERAVSIVTNGIPVLRKLFNSENHDVRVRALVVSRRRSQTIASQILAHLRVYANVRQLVATITASRRWKRERRCSWRLNAKNFFSTPPTRLTFDGADENHFFLLVQQTKVLGLHARRSRIYRLTPTLKSLLSPTRRFSKRSLILARCGGASKQPQTLQICIFRSPAHFASTHLRACELTSIRKTFFTHLKTFAAM